MKPQITYLRVLKGLIGSLLGMALALPAFAVAPGDTVENFTLKDQNGETHELYELEDAEAVAIMIQGNGCPIVRNAMITYRKLRDEYESKGVKFLLLNSNLQDNTKSIKKEADEFGMDIPILVDESQDVGRYFGVYRTGEVFVIDPENWELKYRGALDDRLGYETQKFKADESYVHEVIKSVLANEPIEVAKTDAKGCLVNIIGG